jgi:hypothetical protein
VDLDGLNQHARALQRRLRDGGARLHEHAIGWLGSQGLSEADAAAVVTHAQAMGWVMRLECSQVIIALPRPTRT